MRVLVIGGTGVFGERLARLLVADGHDVCIAARTLSAAQALADELGCRARQVWRDRAAEALGGEDVVIDAAGPFHSYGDDPYALARTALAAGVHYLDLSDNADFCAGITALDAQARAAGRCAISGLSTVPALSSAAVRALAGPDIPRVIDSAILPGNRAPRGLSVMATILEQTGRPIPLWHGGRWEQARGWSNPARYRLPGGLTRQGWLIEVPDLRLFPAHFGAETVRFRAGLELGVMRYGLAALSHIRRVLPFPITRPFLRAIKAAADLLAPFGTGQGGMSVTILTATERRTWSLLAEDGDGPFIPAIAARALLRRAALPIGAGPALETVTLDEAEAAMADLRVRTERQIAPLTPIFPAVLQGSFATLPPEVRATHLTVDCSRWQGQASVRRGPGLWPRLLAALFRFPPASAATEVEVTKTVTAKGETWQRRFGPRRFTSHLAATPKGMAERFGPFTFTLGLAVQDGALHFPVTAGRLGPVPLPRGFLPGSIAREYAVGGRFHFDVKITAPLTGAMIVHYQGWLKPAPPQAPDILPR